MAQETMRFEAEVNKLLDIVVHALYSNREIFLRELISNASDACDRLRYAAITQPELLGEDKDFSIRIAPDPKARTLTIADNGIGMNRDDLIENLGTIAHSGSESFVKALTGDKDKDLALIGQFGVGFYSAFMVADKVEVVTRRAGDDTGWRWVSEGKGEFAVEEAPDAPRGADIVLHLKEDAQEFLDFARLRHVVKQYSDHIALPVLFKDPDSGEETTLNEASALWTRPKSEVTEEQYKEFYRHVAHAFDEPWSTMHYKAEGAIEYTGLLFIPSQKPFDLFHPDRKSALKLYVKRVFITDDAEDLLPAWLRFLRGVVDSQDLPLNVSREMLQHNPVLAKIRSGLIKKVLGELKRRAEDPADYATFWEVFGAVLKEGLYEDQARRDEIMPLVRFHSTGTEGWTSLAEVKARMKEGQEAIYAICGDDAARLSRSPHLEAYKAKGVEVLLLTDPIDEFWTANAPNFEGMPIKLVSEGAAGELDKIAKTDEERKVEEDSAPADQVKTLTDALKAALGDEVKEVRPSRRLTTSAVCLVSEEGEMSVHLERLLRSQGETTGQRPRILEVNPSHALVKALAGKVSAGTTDSVTDAAFLLLDQARIQEGEPVPDPVAFAERMTRVMAEALAR